MVIEHFKNREAQAVFERFVETGRMMPEGINYVEIWIESNFDRCFQLMETDDAALFDAWIANRRDMVDFEIIPVITSAEARSIVIGTV